MGRSVGWWFLCEGVMFQKKGNAENIYYAALLWHIFFNLSSHI